MPFAFDRSVSILRAHRASFIRYFGQSTAPARPERQEATSAAPPVDELQERLKAAEAARNTGDPGSVARANFPVLSLAPRKLGNVHRAFEALAELEAAGRELPQNDYVHYQLQAAYRKESRTADADRELQIYKELKAKNRESAVPRSMERP